MWRPHACARKSQSTIYLYHFQMKEIIYGKPSHPLCPATRRIIHYSKSNYCQRNVSSGSRTLRCRCPGSLLAARTPVNLSALPHLFRTSSSMPEPNWRHGENRKLYIMWFKRNEATTASIERRFLPLRPEGHSPKELSPTGQKLNLPADSFGCPAAYRTASIRI